MLSCNNKKKKQGRILGYPSRGQGKSWNGLKTFWQGCICRNCLKTMKGSVIDRRTDRRTNWPFDITGYRVACTSLKTIYLKKILNKRLQSTSGFRNFARTLHQHAHSRTWSPPSKAWRNSKKSKSDSWRKTAVKAELMKGEVKRTTFSLAGVMVNFCMPICALPVRTSSIIPSHVPSPIDVP